MAVSQCRPLPPLTTRRRPRTVARSGACCRLHPPARACKLAMPPCRSVQSGTVCASHRGTLPTCELRRAATTRWVTLAALLDEASGANRDWSCKAVAWYAAQRACKQHQCPIPLTISILVFIITPPPVHVLLHSKLPWQVPEQALGAPAGRGSPPGGRRGTGALSHR